MRYLKKYEHWTERFGNDRFKIGDIITCIRPASYSYLNFGESYIVTEFNGDLISVNNKNDSINRTRFRLATPEEIEKYKFNNDVIKYNL